MISKIKRPLKSLLNRNMNGKMKLGINIDHAATLRNARGENDPSILEIAFEAQKGGADLITMHLREDRRHIRDADLFLVKEHIKIPVNFEMATTVEMLEIALKLQPKSVCIVPEKREEITTEGGLDIHKNYNTVKPVIRKLTENKIDVFIFVEPDAEAIKISQDCGATGVEIHTGAFARSFFNTNAKNIQMERIYRAADFCSVNKFELHAGHGLNYHNIRDLFQVPGISEVNIGHAILARALLTGLSTAVRAMKLIIHGQ